MQVVLNYPDEFLISVHGTHNYDWSSPTSITQLTFQSNRRTYGPFGTENVKKFSIEATGSKIVGFHGRTPFATFHGLRALGAHLMPLDG